MSNDSLSVFHSAIRSSFSFLKRTKAIDELFAKQLPIDGENGTLLALSDLHLNDSKLIADLSNWRRENQNAFPTRFNVTEAGTANWIKNQLLDIDDRILFLVLDMHGNRIGHLGFANCFSSQSKMEIDNVVRGVLGVAPGIMHKALSTLIKWASTTLGPDFFTLKVLSSNAHAVSFYERFGFQTIKKIPLSMDKTESSETLSPFNADESQVPDDYFLEMVLKEQRSSSTKMILTAGPSVSEREAFYCWDAARNGWNSNWNKYIDSFERTFSSFLGASFAISTSSCTGALHIALAALGIGPGDEVIVPDITWVATANAVSLVGATPVFADVEVESWCIDPNSLLQLITPRTKAVIPVHLYGHPANMDKIMEVARDHNIYVVEDAAPAVGAKWNGKKVGTFGDFACFSFQGAKLLVTGEGGMLVTNNPAHHEKARKIWDQGRDPSRTFWIDSHGLKYKMSNVQAALGLGQIQRCEPQIHMKRRIAEWYREGLENCPHISLMTETPLARSIYWMTSCLVSESSPLSREAICSSLKECKIDTRPVFPAISQYPIWSNKQQPNRVAYSVGNRGINLPSGVCLSRSDVMFVCNELKRIMSCT